MYLERYPQERGKELIMSSIVELSKDAVLVRLGEWGGFGLLPGTVSYLYMSSSLAHKIQSKFGLIRYEYTGVPDKTGVSTFYLTHDESHINEAVEYALGNGAICCGRYSVVQLDNRWFSFDASLALRCSNGNESLVDDNKFLRFWNILTDPTKLDYCYLDNERAFVPRRKYWIGELGLIAG